MQTVSETNSLGQPLSRSLIRWYLWIVGGKWSREINNPKSSTGFFTTDAEHSDDSSKREYTDDRKDIGYIPENVHLYPYLLSWKLGLLLYISWTELLIGRAIRILLQCATGRRTYPKNICVFERMRQKLVRNYIQKAQVYLLDEPASGLDPLASSELSILLKRVAANGAAVLMASHDIFRVRETCNRIGILKRGLLVKEILSDEVTPRELEHIYLNFMKEWGKGLWWGSLHEWRGFIRNHIVRSVSLFFILFDVHFVARTSKATIRSKLNNMLIST